MKAVISLGGSVVGFPPDTGWLRDFRSFVGEFKNDIEAIVVGGGPLARELIRAAAGFDVSKHILDRIGIQATLANAWLVRAALDGMVVEHASLYWAHYRPADKIPVYGGSPLPGLTTDFVAALIAEQTGSVFVNVTRVRGIYDRDPNRHQDAKLIRRVTYDEVERLVVSSDKREPGTHFPLDLAAFSILKRSGIRTYVVGPDIENLRNLFKGGKWIGTEIVP